MTDEDKAALLDKLQAEAYRAIAQMNAWQRKVQELEQKMLPLMPPAPPNG